MVGGVMEQAAAGITSAAASKTMKTRVPVVTSELRACYVN
jgi:hypothetical protein